MKYRVTVDGTAYIVEVEDLGVSAAPVFSSPTVSVPLPVAPAPAPAPVPVAPAPAAAPVPAPAAPAPAPAPVPASAGSVSITAPMPGKIIRVAVSVGQAVKNGEVVVILEAMKMENEIYATADGNVTDIRVDSGVSVNAGDVLLVLG